MYLDMRLYTIRLARAAFSFHLSIAACTSHELYSSMHVASHASTFNLHQCDFTATVVYSPTSYS